MENNGKWKRPPRASRPPLSGTRGLGQVHTRPSDRLVPNRKRTFLSLALASLTEFRTRWNWPTGQPKSISGSRPSQRRYFGQHAHTFNILARHPWLLENFVPFILQLCGVSFLRADQCVLTTDKHRSASPSRREGDGLAQALAASLCRGASYGQLVRLQSGRTKSNERRDAEHTPAYVRQAFQ